jgi:hypothetical protein
LSVVAPPHPPHGRGTETQAWINSIMNGGAAGGAAAVSAVITSILRPPRPPENPAGHARDRGSHPGSFG